MSNRRPQTIQFFLPHGEPRGIRIAQITTRILQAIYVPRSRLKEAGDRSELRSVGVYFLFGQPEEAAKPLCYIGEAEDCYIRLKQHNVGKDFWKQAIAVVSRTGTFTKAHARYLEWYCICQAREVGRYALENGNNSGEPFITEPMRADLMDAFDTLNALTSTLGFPVVERRPAEDESELFFLSGKDAEAKGQMVEDGFMVLAGSLARKDMVPSATSWLPARREKLFESGVLEDDGDRLLFTEDYAFDTPTGAATMVAGASANGWTAWKNKAGKTLSELKRGPQDEAEEQTAGAP